MCEPMTQRKREVRLVRKRRSIGMDRDAEVLQLLLCGAGKRYCLVQGADID